MYSILFFGLAMFFNSICDTLQHHFGTSIFKNLDPQWWNPAVSWVNKADMFTQTSDAWHLSKTLMLICFIAAIVVYKPMVRLFKQDWLNKTADALIIGSAGVLVVFNAFYSYILVPN